jgi:hypothetical protein
MGAEAEATVTFRRKTSAGKALLETSELIFRGDVRLKIPFKDITALNATNGRLSVTFPDGTAVFTLGAKAEQWAQKIGNPKSLIDKLGVKPGHRVVVIDVHDTAFETELSQRTHDVSTRLRRDVDAIFLGADSVAALRKLHKLRDYIKREGMIWTITPKGKNRIKDSDVMAAGKQAGLVDVKVAAFSDTHTASKFVIPKAQR